MKRRFKTVVAGLVLVGSAMVLGEVFPSLRPYLPTFDNTSDGFNEKTKAHSNDNTAPEKVATDVVLALSWTSAFCETRPEKRECKSQHKGRYDATHFALHGLWPEPQYCTRAPYKNVSSNLWKAMQQAMPGTQSGLHKHEWEKHGTCYSKTPERYYRDSLRLVVAFNESAVRDLFKDKIGAFVTAHDIRAQFDKAFGKGAGDRVLVHCVKDQGRTLIQELRVRLKGKIETANLPVLLKQARPQKRGCKGGIIDAVGLQ